MVAEYIHPTSICTLDLSISTSLAIIHELASLTCPSLNTQQRYCGNGRNTEVNNSTEQESEATMPEIKNNHGILGK